MNSLKILFTGGGTGGHILPIIAVVREIKRISNNENIHFFYLGPRDDFGLILLSQEGVRIKTVFSGKWRRYLNWRAILQNLADIFFKIPFGIFQAFIFIFALAPDLIFSKGGFGSIPGVAAGRFLFVPVFLHESDVAPGMANKFLSKFAKKIFVSFPEKTTEYFPLKKMMMVGNPVRKEILEGTKEKAKEIFKIISEKPVILVLGGSQGAQRINDKILGILPQLLNDFEIIHQTGEKNFKQVSAEAKTVLTPETEKSYHVFPFLKEEEYKQALATASLAISRAGSGGIFELAAAGLPSILIPLPESAQNHQVKNAYAYQNSGATIVLEEPNFTPNFFLEKIKYLFLHPQELENMRQKALAFAKPAAAKTLAQELLNYLVK